MFLILYKTVCIAGSRYMLSRAGVPRHAIIKKFAGESISKLEDLLSVLAKLSKGARVPLEYVNYMDRHRNKVFDVLICILLFQLFALIFVFIKFRVFLLATFLMCVLKPYNLLLNLSYFLLQSNILKPTWHFFFLLSHLADGFSWTVLASYTIVFYSEELKP